jgi:hypothetical protein
MPLAGQPSPYICAELKFAPAVDVTALASNYINRRAHSGRAVKIELALVAEGDNAVYEGKDSVVLAKAYIVARHYAGAALAHYNVARLGHLAGIELNAEVFSLGVV